MKRTLPSVPRGVRRLLRGERGQALVETAIVLPFLLILLLGLVQFGLIFNSYLTLEEAARVGVRAWADDQATTQAAIQTVVDQAMPNLIQSDIGTIELCTVSSSTCSSTTYSSMTSLQEPPGTLLAVVVSYTEPIIVPPFDAIFGSTLPFSATVWMEAE